MQFKFIQLNVWFSGKLLDNAVPFLKEQNADVLAIQEIYWPQPHKHDKRHQALAILKKELGMEYVDFVPSFIDSGAEDALWGLAVLSKFPIVKSQSTYISKSFNEYDRDKISDYGELPRNLQDVTLDIHGKKLHVCNVHGIWGFDEEDNDVRLAMADKIIAELPPNEPVILCGDLNVGQNTQTIAKLESHLTNIFKGELTTSFNTNVKKGGGFAKSVVDFVFISDHIRVLQHEVPVVDVSDHLPLVCEFEVE